MSAKRRASDPATRAALRRATDAVAHAVPMTPSEDAHEVFTWTFWLHHNAGALGAEALNELADKLRPLRKEGSR